MENSKSRRRIVASHQAERFRFYTDWMEQDAADRVLACIHDDLPNFLLWTEDEVWRGSNLGMAPSYQMRLEMRNYCRRAWAEHWAGAGGYLQSGALADEC